MTTQTLITLSPDDLHGMIVNATSEAIATLLPRLQPVTPPPRDDIQHMTRCDVLKALSITAPTLRAMESRRQLVPKRIGRKVIFRRSDVERFLKQ